VRSSQRVPRRIQTAVLEKPRELRSEAEVRALARPVADCRNEATRPPVRRRDRAKRAPEEPVESSEANARRLDGGARGYSLRGGREPHYPRHGGRHRHARAQGHDHGGGACARDALRRARARARARARGADGREIHARHHVGARQSHRETPCEQLARPRSRRAKAGTQARGRYRPVAFEHGDPLLRDGSDFAMADQPPVWVSSSSDVVRSTTRKSVPSSAIDSQHRDEKPPGRTHAFRGVGAPARLRGLRRCARFGTPCLCTAPTC